MADITAGLEDTINILFRGLFDKGPRAGNSCVCWVAVKMRFRRQATKIKFQNEPKGKSVPQSNPGQWSPKSDPIIGLFGGLRPDPSKDLQHYKSHYHHWH